MAAVAPDLYNVLIRRVAAVITAICSVAVSPAAASVVSAFIIISHK